jgi:predicted helicase
MLDFYNVETDRFDIANQGLERNKRLEIVSEFVDSDPAKISWTENLKKDLVKNQKLNFDANNIVVSLYRPFTKQWLYHDRKLNERVYQIPRIFPDVATKNYVICCLGLGSKKDYSVLISDAIPNYDNLEKGQCFSLFLYENSPDEDENNQQGDLLSDIQEQGTESNTQGYTRKDAITDEGLAHFRAAYPNQSISKEDVFYYVYGLLHSPDYRERYADNLSKELPRIPCVKTYTDFQAFSQAGRDLAELHLNYETVAMYPAQIAGGASTERQ